MTQLSKLLNNPQTLVGVFALAVTVGGGALMTAYRDNSPEQNAKLKANITSKFEENGFKILGAQDERGTFGGLNGCYTLTSSAQTAPTPTHTGCASASDRVTQIYALRSLGAKQ